MAKNLTPQEFADKYARRTSAAVQDMAKGVMGVKIAPGAQAALKQDKMLANLTESITSGRWANRVKSVSLESWQQSMSTKGVQRMAQGVEAARPKMEAFAAQLLPFQADLSAKISKMSDLTLEDSVARSAAWIRGMSEFRKVRR